MIKCWHYRRIISSSVDANAALPHPAQNHLQICPACREYYEAETKIARQLSAGAGAQQRSPSPFLHARIMSSIANPLPVAGERRQMPGRLGWSVALVTACIFLAGILWLRHQPSPFGLVGPLASGSAPVSSESALPVKLPDALQFREWTTKLDEPLANEMKLVVNDAKTAMNSLADNFLPGALRASLFEPAQN
jgi:hypothetical protein